MLSKVLVYGTLKKDFSNHGLLSMAKFLGKTEVPGKMYSLKAFPGVRLDEPGSVKCEVYEVDEVTLKRLDRLEGYRGPGKDNFYDRSNVRFTVEGESDSGTGYIYEIGREFLNDKEVVQSGEWV